MYFQFAIRRRRDYIRRDLISCVMYELMRELRHAFLTADSRALIVHRNLTLDLYASRLKLQIQSVNWLEGTRRRIGFSSRSAPALPRKRGDNATRFNNSELFSFPLPPFFLSLSSYFLQDRRTLNNPRSTNAIRCLAEEEKRVSPLSWEETSLGCAFRFRVFIAPRVEDIRESITLAA